jgi:hypothetical protein
MPAEDAAQAFDTVASNGAQCITFSKALIG